MKIRKEHMLCLNRCEFLIIAIDPYINTAISDIWSEFDGIAIR